MDTIKYGYYGTILEINLTTGKIEKKAISAEDMKNFIGGRGLGMKILWDKLKEPGINPLSPENPLIFTAGPFSAFPIPSSSRVCVITKSTHTSPVQSKYPFASTVTYSNMGGFFGPEIRFAGYDGIVITGKATKPVYIVINDDKAEIRDAKKFWGMGTDEFDKEFIGELGDRQFETCYIGPAGENLVDYACILHTAARAAGRGGGGCVMGSKNIKAIAVKGSKMPSIKNYKQFVNMLEGTRNVFQNPEITDWARTGGTTRALVSYSKRGIQTVKNFREGTFEGAENLGPAAAWKNIWSRSFSCYLCPLACKKSGVIKSGSYAGTIVHDGPEFETGTMLGSNLLISDLEGLMKCVYVCDDLGIDAISAGNTIGFLMEAYEKKYIDKKFLDGIDLTWGNVDAVLKMLNKITYKEGIGELASKGVKSLSEKIGKDSRKFAIHVKGQELAAHNIYGVIEKGIGYIFSNRGACHLNGRNIIEQNENAVIDSLGICRFVTGDVSHNAWLRDYFAAITGVQWTEEEYLKVGERIFNLEKMFNYREGFNRKDDKLPDRFFEESPTTGATKGAVLKRDEFNEIVNKYYIDRGWNIKTSKPSKAKLESLGLLFTMQS